MEQRDPTEHITHLIPHALLPDRKSRKRPEERLLLLLLLLLLAAHALFACYLWTEWISEFRVAESPAQTASFGSGCRRALSANMNQTATVSQVKCQSSKSIKVRLYHPFSYSCTTDFGLISPPWLRCSGDGEMKFGD